MNNWYQLLDFIQGNSLIIMLVALSVALYRSRQSSVVVAAVVVSACFFVQMGFDVFNCWLWDSEYYQGAIADIADRAWYLFYAGTNIIVINAIPKMCANLRLKPDPFCNALVYIYSLLALIQITRYIDAFIVNANYTSGIYEASIPLLNILIVAVLVTGLFKLDGIEKE